MKIKTPQLTGAALDWAVAKCEGMIRPDGGTYAGYHGNIHRFKPSTDWAQGGPIIEREKIELKYLGYDNPPYWGALKFAPSKYERKGATGPTPLIAAMRCYVASKLGDEVEIPAELCNRINEITHKTEVAA